jgi:hypothetical protein
MNEIRNISNKLTTTLSLVTRREEEMDLKKLSLPSFFFYASAVSNLAWGGPFLQQTTMILPRSQASDLVGSR